MFHGWDQKRTFQFEWEVLCLEKSNTLYSILRTLSWFGPVLLHLCQDTLPSLMEQWFSELCQWITKEDIRSLSRKCGRTNHKHSSHTKLGLKNNKCNVLACWKCCGRTWSEQSMWGHYQMWGHIWKLKLFCTEEYWKQAYLFTHRYVKLDHCLCK